MRFLLLALLIAGTVAGQPLETCGDVLPLVANTWAFTAATQAAWDAMTTPDAASPALDAVEKVRAATAAWQTPPGAAS